MAKVGKKYVQRNRANLGKGRCNEGNEGKRGSWEGGKLGEAERLEVRTQARGLRMRLRPQCINLQLSSLLFERP